MFGFKKIKQGKIATNELSKATAIVNNLKYNDVDFNDKVTAIHEHCNVALEYAKQTGEITQKYVHDSLDLIYQMVDIQSDLKNRV